MSGLLARAGALFVAPAVEAAAFAPPRARVGIVGVLGERKDLLVVAGAEAAALRREAGAAFALVVLAGFPAPPGLAAPAAGRAAAKLVRRGIPARAYGALCLVEAPDARAAVAAVDAPVVIASTRREPELDALLATADRLVLATGDDPLLAELAAGDLARLGPPVTLATPAAGLLARQAARLGLAAARPIPAPEPA
jgi:hypothetical protein